MPGGLLYVLSWARRFPAPWYGGAHRWHRAPPIEAAPDGVFAHHAVSGIRFHAPALVLALAVVLEGPEQRPVEIGAVPRYAQMRAAVCGLMAKQSRRLPLRETRKE